MEEVITVNDRIKRWKLLSNSIHPNQQQNTKPSNDPFSCEELIIPPTLDLVKTELKQQLQEWQELDSRLVTSDSTKGSRKRKHDGLDDNDDNDDKNSKNDDDDQSDSGSEIIEQPPVGSGDYAGLDWGWHANRIRLPDFFDYACKGDPPQPPGNIEQRSKRRQVVSLEDPTQLLDYESELWKIFSNIPSLYDIESKATQGAICKETIKIKNEIEKGLKDYTRVDGHSLNRMRKRERHHWPRVCIQRNIDTQEQGLGDIVGATIRVEFWRRQLKRGSSTDANRCEFELIESQTLLDLHNILVSSSQDDLFEYGMQKEHYNNNQDVPNLSSRGYFFIEDTFYTHGDVDYVSPIIKWLDEEVTCKPRKMNEKDGENGKKKRKYTKKAPPSVIRSRREYLGIKKDAELKVAPMCEAKLGDIPFRLACRYVHVFNGDCESSLLFSDVCMRMSNENVKESQYPLVHDILTTVANKSTIQESSTCQGCEQGAPTVMTLNDELTDGGPTLLCPNCYADLHYDKDGKLLYNNFEVVPISVLQNLKDLSVGNDEVDALF